MDYTKLFKTNKKALLISESHSFWTAIKESRGFVLPEEDWNALITNTLTGQSDKNYAVITGDLVDSTGIEDDDKEILAGIASDITKPSLFLL